MHDKLEKASPIAPRSQYFSINSPIGIIAGMLAIIELILILGVIFTDGAAQWAMIVLAAGALFGLGGSFVWLLAKKNWVLYTPSEFGGETGVAAYVEAMTQTKIGTIDTDALAESVRKSIKDSFSTREAVRGIDHIFGESPREEVNHAMLQQIGRMLDQWIDRSSTRVAEEVIEQNFISIFSQMESGIEQIGTAPYSDDVLINGFLDYVGNMGIPDTIANIYSLRHNANPAVHHFGPYYVGYGDFWILRDMDTGRDLKDIGPRRKEPKGGILDPRTMGEAGLRPGMRLEARLLD